jgi:hypothetical protein
MPTSCSLYPLGELWTNKATNQSFYSVDSATNCEGIGVLKPQVNAIRTVQQYRVDNQLIHRRAQWDWFRDLVLKFSSRQLGQRLATLTVNTEEAVASSDLVFMMAEGLWYDFDSVPLAAKFRGNLKIFRYIGWYMISNRISVIVLMITRRRKASS